MRYFDVSPKALEGLNRYESRFELQCGSENIQVNLCDLFLLSMVVRKLEAPEPVLHRVGCDSPREAGHSHLLPIANDTPAGPIASDYSTLCGLVSPLSPSRSDALGNSFRWW